MLIARRHLGMRLPLAAVASALLAAGACTRLDDPNDPDATSVVSLEASDATLSADGASSTEITATLAKETATGTELTFATDAGTLTGSGSTGGNEIKVTAAGSREISVRLVAPTTVATATVTVKVGSGFASTTVKFEAAEPDTLELTADVVTALANGQDPITLTATALRKTLGEKVTEGTRVQFLVTRSGATDSQLSGSGDTDAAGRATRRLVTGTSGTYRIVASAGFSGAVRSDTIEVTFTPVP